MDSSDDRVLLYVLKMCVLSFLAQPACPCFGSRGDHVRFDAFSRYVTLKLILLHNPFSSSAARPTLARMHPREKYRFDVTLNK
jgi:hypothetical protein